MLAWAVSAYPSMQGGSMDGGNGGVQPESMGASPPGFGQNRQGSGQGGQQSAQGMGGPGWGPGQGMDNGSMSGPGGSHGGMPPTMNRSDGPMEAAVESCAGLDENATCGFSSSGGNVSGTCRLGHNDTLICQPAFGGTGQRFNDTRPGQGGQQSAQGMGGQGGVSGMDNGSMSGPGGSHGGMPPTMNRSDERMQNALEACADLIENDTCNMGNLPGICVSSHDNALLCQQNQANPRPGEPRNGMPLTMNRSDGPMEAAVESCAGLDENATCGFSSSGGNVSGTCRLGQNDTLICQPAFGGTGQGFNDTGPHRGMQPATDDGQQASGGEVQGGADAQEQGQGALFDFFSSIWKSLSILFK
jgi:hypothetical protein